MSSCPKGCMNVPQWANVCLLQFCVCLYVAVPVIISNRVPLSLCLSDVPSVFRHMRIFVSCFGGT